MLWWEKVGVLFGSLKLASCFQDHTTLSFLGVGIPGSVLRYDSYLYLGTLCGVRDWNQVSQDAQHLVSCSVYCSVLFSDGYLKKLGPFFCGEVGFGSSWSQFPTLITPGGVRGI